jgi:uncharacterized membrane protein YoaK (UPF0700 family)
MIHYHRSIRTFAICLSAVAGYVDAVGFIALGGFFVSFMSGNSTRLSVGLAGGSGDAALAGGLIASFLLGVVLGSITGKFTLARRRPASILGLVALLLGAASALASLGARTEALALVAAAMGAKNTIFERDGEVSIGLTYMTGALVKVGQRLAAVLLGAGDRLGWLPYFLLWLGLVGGAVLGAAAYGYLGLNTLWLAAGMELLLACTALRLRWQPDLDERA